MKTRLDAAVVAAAECPPGKKRLDIYAENVPNMVLEVRPSGGKTYYLRFTNRYGKQQQVKVGRADHISFDQARKAARRLLSEVTLGGDPAADKAQAKAVPLYADLAAQHMADARLHQRSASTTEGYIRNHLLPRWGKVRVSDIDPRAVAQWLAEKRADGLAPATVVKMKAILGRSFELGRRWRVPGTDRNPVRGVPTAPLNNARERSLTAEEMGRLRAAAAESRNTQLPAIVELLVATGCRLRELLDARWENVDVERRSWLVPTSKNGRSRHVPLSGAALAAIAGLPRWDGCQWLVPNPETLRPFVTVKNAWRAAIQAAVLPGLRLHDLRHAAASAMVSAGVDIYAVGKVLGHRNVASTQRYAHVANATLLAAVEAGAAKLQSTAAR